MAIDDNHGNRFLVKRTCARTSTNQRELRNMFNLWAREPKKRTIKITFVSDALDLLSFKDVMVDRILSTRRVYNLTSHVVRYESEIAAVLAQKHSKCILFCRNKRRVIHKNYSASPI